jgi:hypothetical protein
LPAGDQGRQNAAAGGRQLAAVHHRKECRWFAQEGAAACMRCPEITTISYDLSPQVREVSGLPVTEETIVG